MNGESPVSRTARVLFDSQTLSTAVNYSFFGPTPNALPNNYQRNPLPFSVTTVYGIRASLNVNSLTPAVVTILHSAKVTITKNQVNIFAADMTTLYGIDNGGNFSATNQFVIFNPQFYSLGKDPIVFRDTEPFEVLVNFGTAPTNTDQLRIHMNAKCIDRLEKKAN